MKIEINAKSRLIEAASDMGNTAVAKYIADNAAKFKKFGGAVDVYVRGKCVSAQAGKTESPVYLSIKLQPNGKWSVEFVTRFKSEFKPGDKISDAQAASLLDSFVKTQAKP